MQERIRRGEARLLGPFYAYMFVAVTTMAVFPFMVIYFLDLGFSLSQYFMLIGVWTAGTVFFEVPTGVVADSYSRKWSVITGLAVAGVSAIGLGLTDSYPLLLVLFAINGIGFTFFSGAEDAWAIDNLCHYNRGDLIKAFYAKNQAIMYLGMVAGPLAAGAIVAVWGIRPLWFIWGGGYLLTAAGLTLMAEHFTPERRTSSTARGQTFKQTGEAMRLLKSDRNLGMAFVATAFMALLFLDNGFWQPLLVDLELPVAGIGYVTAGAALVGAVVSLVIPRLGSFDFRVLLASGIVTKMILLIAVPLLYGPRYLIASAMFVALEATGTFEGPLLNPYIQQRLPSRLRATAVSIKSMLFKVIMGIGGITLGIVADRTSLRTVFPIIAVFGFGALWALSRMDRGQPPHSVDPTPEERESAVLATTVYQSIIQTRSVPWTNTQRTTTTGTGGPPPPSSTCLAQPESPGLRISTTPSLAWWIPNQA